MSPPFLGPGLPAAGWVRWIDDGRPPPGLHPDVPLVHQVDLPLVDLFPVFGVLHRRPVQVQVLGIDGLIIDDLIELGPQVLDPVVPLGPGAVVAHGLDVDHPRDVCGARAVLLLADDLPLVVDDEGPSPEGVDGGVLLREQVIRPHVGRDDVHVVVQRAG